MILPDVNVLVYAHREDAEDYARYRQWLEEIIQSGQPYGISDHVLGGFLRAVTHPRVFTTPSPISPALDCVRQIREPSNCQLIAPGSRYWPAWAVSVCNQFSVCERLSHSKQTGRTFLSQTRSRGCQSAPSSPVGAEISADSRRRLRGYGPRGCGQLDSGGALDSGAFI